MVNSTMYMPYIRFSYKRGVGDAAPYRSLRLLLYALEVQIATTVVRDGLAMTPN